MVLVIFQEGILWSGGNGNDCDWLRSKLAKLARKRRDLGDVGTVFIPLGGICSVVKRKGERRL